jgi:hypothetical protein
MTPDCWACRATAARFCATCVKQAITERHASLDEFAHDKARLEASMAEPLARRQRVLEQREGRRLHKLRVDKLNAQLSAVRRGTDHLVRSALHAQVAPAPVRARPARSQRAACTPPPPGANARR